MKHYDIEKSPQGAFNLYVCKHCGKKKRSLYGFQVHIQAFHPDLLEKPVESEKTYSKNELIELAKANGITIRGKKAEIAERLRREGISL